jgi:hypothetical protein
MNFIFFITLFIAASFGFVFESFEILFLLTVILFFLEGKNLLTTENQPFFIRQTLILYLVSWNRFKNKKAPIFWEEQNSMFGLALKLK